MGKLGPVDCDQGQLVSFLCKHSPTSHRSTYTHAQAGDYGSIDKETGRFVKEGNIYSEPSLSSLAAEYKPETGEAIGEYIVKSSNTIQRDVGVNAHA